MISKNLIKFSSSAFLMARLSISDISLSLISQIVKSFFNHNLFLSAFAQVLSSCSSLNNLILQSQAVNHNIDFIAFSFSDVSSLITFIKSMICLP